MLSLDFTRSCLHVMNISFWVSGFLLTLVFGPDQSQVVNIPASHLSCYFVPFFFLKVLSQSVRVVRENSGMSDQIWSLPCYHIIPVTLMLGPSFGGFLNRKLKLALQQMKTWSWPTCWNIIWGSHRLQRSDWQLKSPVKKLALLNMAIYVMMSLLTGSLVPEESGFGRLWER